MKKAFQLIDTRTNEIIMYGESARSCRVYAVKYEHAKTLAVKNETVRKICAKANIDKNFYRLGLEKIYSITEVEMPKIYSMIEVNALNEWSIFQKFFKKFRENP